MPTTDLDPSAWSDWLNNFLNRPYQAPGGGNEFVNPQTLPDIYRGGPGAITSEAPGAPMQLPGAMPPMPAGGALANGGGGAPPFIGGGEAAEAAAEAEACPPAHCQLPLAAGPGIRWRASAA